MTKVDVAGFDEIVRRLYPDDPDDLGELLYKRPPPVCVHGRPRAECEEPECLVEEVMLS